MPKKDPYDMTTKMMLLEKSHPAPPLEVQEQEQERVRLLLTRHDVLDVAPLLGLSA